jgi:transposase
VLRTDDGADAKGLLEALLQRRCSPGAGEIGRSAGARGTPSHPIGLDSHRTARLNLLRGRLRELGYSIPVGARQVVPPCGSSSPDADSGLPDTLRPALAEIAREIRELESRVREVERSLEAMARKSEILVRLRTIPGVGLLTATALVAFVGDVQRFPSGRHFASYLGLTPRESSSGLRRHLGAISKRGDPYLRMLLIHGARAVLLHAKKATAERDRLRTWALGRERARGHNKAAVALANKLARIVWAVWRSERAFAIRAQN